VYTERLAAKLPQNYPAKMEADAQKGDKYGHRSVENNAFNGCK
jgi:hypothetical protein